MSKQNKVRVISPRLFKFIMNLYPPFLFSRTVIQHVSADFRKIDIVIKKSLFNRNLSGTIFGGTLFSASDPFYALMYWQNFAVRYEMDVQVWLKSASIKYIKPATKDVYLHFELTNEDIEEAKKDLDDKGKHNKEHQVELVNKNGDVYALVDVVSYVGVK